MPGRWAQHAALCCLSACVARAAAGYAPEAAADAQVLCDDYTRVSVLTGRVVRFEVSPDGRFEDRGTITFPNRRTAAVAAVVVTRGGGWCNMTATAAAPSTAPALDISLRVCATPACAADLAGRGIRAASAAGGWSWAFGDAPTGNLKGTIHPTPSPDLAGCCSGCANAKEGDCGAKFNLEAGLLSKDGWAVINDSAALPLDMTAAPPDASFETYFRTSWVSPEPRRGGVEDFYLFGCGTMYRECLADFTALSGPVALPPINTLGVWWSRHWGDESANKAMVDDVGVMTARNLESQVLDAYAARGLPLHVMVLDMEWHSELKAPDCSFRGIAGWGGYTWNETLFPDVPGLVNRLHAVGGEGATGVQMSLNYHPDSGVDSCQKMYKPFARALGLESYVAANRTLPDLDAMEYNKTYVDAYFEHVIAPLLADIAWTDTPKATTWSNDLYVRYAERPAAADMKAAGKPRRRGVNFSRYGGLGNHRTPMGMSGDTQRQWETLQYEVYFTHHASNVGFAWWSHSIGGFKGEHIDSDWHTEPPELFLRWLQFAAFAPVFRTHCRYCDQRIWTWGRYDNETGLPGTGYYALMREAMLLRNALVPYVYTHAALRTWQHGEGLLTPMYWDPAAAAHDDAYSALAGQQYWFGRDAFAAPVTDPRASTRDAAVARTLWVPPGTWARLGAWDDVVSGPETVTRNVTLAETPAYFRAGALVPTRGNESTYRASADPLVWWVIPGAASGSGALYEDDGTSTAHRSGAAHSVIEAAHARAASSWNATVSAAAGSFPTMLATRSHGFTLKGERRAPAALHCDGAAVPPAPAGGGQGWWYVPDVPADVDPRAPSSLHVQCGPWAQDRVHTVAVTFA